MLKENLRIFCLENNTKSLLEMEPIPDEPDYIVVEKLDGVDGPNRCLRYNNDETVLLGNRGSSITGMKVLNGKGVQKTRMNIQSQTPPINDTMVEFEDYVAIGSNGIIAGNNQGVLEGFEYNINTGDHVKRFEFNLNQGRPANLFQQITSMSLSDDQQYLAVSTAIDNQRVQACLNKLFVFAITPQGLKIVDTKDFPNSNADSMYFYIDFDYRYRGTRMIFAFQSDDQMRVDAYAFENERIELVHSVYNYHQEPFSAIRGLSGSIISIDYVGGMKIMTIPE